jgi:DNA-binding HxlR family transcriptional regulator
MISTYGDGQVVDISTVECRTVTSIFTRVGDKWTLLIILYLGDGPQRFNHIKRHVKGISQRMLTLTLRGLERDGLVVRTVTPDNPPHVHYRLSLLGRRLWDARGPLCSWAKRSVPEVVKARAQYDESSELAAPPSAGPDTAAQVELKA